MKSIIKIVICFFLINYSYGQVEWAKQFYSSSKTYNEFCQTFTDGISNYMIGTFEGSLYFPNSTLYAVGSNEIFISKFDTNGNIVWNKTLLGPSNPPNLEAGYAVFDSVNQCIYVAGHFINQLTFPGLTTLYGSFDIFISKMDLDGNFIWAKKAGGNGIDKTRIYVNSFGKIYLVAESTDSCSYENFRIGPGGAIVTYDTDGNCLSAELKYNTNFEYPNYVSLDFIEKDIVYYGSFMSKNFNLDTVTFSNFGSNDGFIARADSTGRIKWIKKISSSGTEFITKIAVLQNKDIVFGCQISDNLNFIDTLLNVSGNDIVLATLSEDGNLKWVSQFNLNSTSLSGILGIKINASQNLIVSGYYCGTTNIGNIKHKSFTEMDMFLAKFDTLGNGSSFFHFGKAYSNSLNLDNDDNIYVSGNFYNNVSIGNVSLTLLGDKSDIYIAKFDSKWGNSLRALRNNTLLIYANPNNGTCQIAIPNELKNSTNLTMIIYDAQGRLIQKQQIPQFQDIQKLSLEERAKGMYNIALGDGYIMHYGKIIVE